MLLPENIYPWQVNQWQQLIAYKQKNCLPHALMFLGQEGLGKKELALTFAQTLLCNKSSIPCRQCHACHLLAAQSHPDLILIEPDKPGHMIKIDQIRELTQFTNETALQGKFRIIVINPANNMNMNAANALLKTLEEPPPNTILILVTDRIFRLPATIISRCHKIIFQKPAKEIGLEWLLSQITHNKADIKLLLKLADGAPLKAKEFFQNNLLLLRQELYQGLDSLARNNEDPIKLAEKLYENDMMMTLNLLLLWLQDLLRLKLTDSPAEIINVDYQSHFVKLSNKLNCDNLLNYIDRVKEAYAHLLNGLNLNRQFILEELFVRWMQYAAR